MRYEMKAWILHGIGDIRLETVKKPEPGVGEALVAVKAVGICGSDIPRIYQTGAHVHPLIPGHEFSGVVEAVGDGVSDAWTGRRVGVFPLIPCGECEPCGKKQYEMCRNYGYTGSRRDGAFAEYVTVPAGNLLELPDSVTFEEAAMLEPMAVAVHAIRRTVISGSDTAAVCGLGTIGMLSLMFLLDREEQSVTGGMAAGFPVLTSEILAVGNKDFQKEISIKLGLPAENYCNSREEDAGEWLARKTLGRGTDVFFECVGKNETVSLAAAGAAPGGRIVLVGNPGSDMLLKRDVYWKILRNQLTLSGTWNSSFTHETGDDWHYVLDRISRKRIAPAKLISHRFPLEELDKGLEIMRDKSEEYIKIMGTVN